MTTSTMTTTACWPEVVLIATQDADATLACRDEAEAVAQSVADELREFVTIRCPTTDRLIATIEPAVRAETMQDLRDYYAAMRD